MRELKEDLVSAELKRHRQQLLGVFDQSVQTTAMLEESSGGCCESGYSACTGSYSIVETRIENEA